MGYIKENNRKKYSISNPEVVFDRLKRRQKEFEDLTLLSGKVSVQEVIELSVPELDAERMLLKVVKQST